MVGGRIFNVQNSMPMRLRSQALFRGDWWLRVDSNHGPTEKQIPVSDAPSGRFDSIYLSVTKVVRRASPFTRSRRHALSQE